MKKRILVIDDDEATLDLLEQVLEFSGYEVKVSKNADQIFDGIEEFKPNLVLIDYLLPMINGGEICHQIRMNGLTSGLPVVLMSASPRVFQSLGTYGCNTFIAKPFAITELTDTLNGCLKVQGQH